MEVKKIQLKLQEHRRHLLQQKKMAKDGLHREPQNIC